MNYRSQKDMNLIDLTLPWSSIETNEKLVSLKSAGLLIRVLFMISGSIP